MKLHFKLLLILFSGFITLGGLAIAQEQDKNLAKLLTDETDLLEYNSTQTGINQTTAEFERLLTIAQNAAPKDIGEKANLWSSLETNYLRNKIFADRYNALVVKVCAYSKMPECKLELAPDKKTVVIRPKAQTKIEQGKN